MKTIEIKNITKEYKTFKLDDVSFNVEDGHIVGFIGRNGAGKTTLIKLLCRLYEPTEGEILLDGVNIREYDYEEYMKLFAPVFQDFKLFAFSMKENALLKSSATEEENTKLMDILKSVGLSDMISSLREGIDTAVYKHYNEDGIEPSGGEQQKLAIARALYKNSPVVILDEPTAA